MDEKGGEVGDEGGNNVSADRVSPNRTALRPEATANSSEIDKISSILHIEVGFNFTNGGSSGLQVDCTSV